MIDIVVFLFVVFAVVADFVVVMTVYIVLIVMVP